MEKRDLLKLALVSALLSFLLKDGKGENCPDIRVDVVMLMLSVCLVYFNLN